jgi:hypothetical protein
MNAANHDDDETLSVFSNRLLYRQALLYRLTIVIEMEMMDLSNLETLEAR